jgi:hyperosmotically inducible protein
MQNRKLIAPFLAVALLSAASIAPSYAADAMSAPQSAPATKMEKAGAVMDDALITTKVKAALLEDKSVSALKINVTTKQGVVVLTGTVPGAEAGQHAVQLVAGIEGVKSVKSELQVKAAGY